MAETSAMNSDNKVEQAEALTAVEDGIKKEVDVKSEPQECLLCVTRTREWHDIYATSTAASGTSLHQFLLKFTQVNFSDAQNCSKYICKSCFDLINVLEQAEIEYIKLKETFEAIISKNPLFENGLSPPLKLSTVKAEMCGEDDDDDDDESVNFANLEEDSEDEPLVRTKKRRRKVHTKKKKTTSSKRRVAKIEQSWECDICGLQGETGGNEAEAHHKLTKHDMSEINPVLRDVKTEDSADGSQSPYNNGFETCLQLGFDNFDGEASLMEPLDKSTKKRKVSEDRKSKLLSTQKLKKPKVMHQCDQCSARYTSLTRLEQHKQKHDGSKPPYICEICGAHYKHKRACDIHIAMHKGISDWKCEECNKLFPSKNALQRHNNIHTGKLNYQCDLCGKSFIHTSSFKMHKLSHSGVKPHACDVCGLALMTRSHLKRHKRIHSGEKRHECAVCGKRFSERYNLAAHAKSHAAADAAPAQAPRRRLFRCAFCPERFERRYMLERHTSAAHGRTLERPPPTPRNTMSKLLKAQALARAPDLESKRDRSPAHTPAHAPPHTPAHTPQKLLAQLSSSASIITTGSWSGAYAAEFGLRPDFPH